MRAFITAAILLTACASSPAPPAESLLAAQIDAYLRPYVDAHEFSGSVIVARREEILFERSYGLSNLERSARNNAATTFTIASLSKSFTAAVIERLIAQGRMSVSDPVSRFIPDFPNGDRITVRMLLLHRSGLAPEDDLPDYETRRFQAIPLQEQAARIGAHPLLYEPGTSGSYSNSGYVVLAAIAERASGKDFDTLLREEVLARINARSTGIENPSTRSGPSARSYLPGPPPSLLHPAEPDAHPSHYIGAGVMYSTARDLLAFLRASDNGGALDVTTLEYPYGWGVREYHGRREIEQTGIDEGFNAAMAFYPDDDIYIAYVSNVRSSAFFQRAHIDIGAIVLGQSVQAFTPIVRDATPRDLSAYVGRYQFGEHGQIGVRSEGGALWLDWFSQRHYLDPIAGGGFYDRQEAAPINFEPGAPAPALLWGNGENAVRSPRVS